MKKHTYAFISFVLIILIGASIAIFQRNSLRKNHDISTGNVVGIDTGPQNPEIFVDFTFSDNLSHIQRGRSSILGSSKSQDYNFLNLLLMNKILPIVYEKGNPSNNQMLFSKKDCIKYAIVLNPSEETLINTIDSLIAKER